MLKVQILLRLNATELLHYVLFNFIDLLYKVDQRIWVKNIQCNSRLYGLLMNQLVHIATKEMFKNFVSFGVWTRSVDIFRKQTTFHHD